MNDLLWVCCFCCALIKISEVFPDLHFTVDRKDREEIVRLQLLDMFYLLKRGKRRGNVGAIEMFFQIGQDDLQTMEHGLIGIVEGKRDGWLHLLFFSLPAFDQEILDDFLFRMKNIHEREHR